MSSKPVQQIAQPSLESDVIYFVTGVPAKLIVDRARRLRPERTAGPGTARRSPATSMTDLRRLGNADFVDEAHVVILHRPPRYQERIRRIGELERGKSRVELAARLMWSAEGRNAKPHVRGPVLGAMVLMARIANLTASIPGLQVLARHLISVYRRRASAK